jgi:hypothetical protein
MRCPSSRPRAAYESFSLANMSAARMRRASIAARARRGRTAFFVPLLDAAFVDVVFKSDPRPHYEKPSGLGTVGREHRTPCQRTRKARLRLPLKIRAGIPWLDSAALCDLTAELESAFQISPAPLAA